MNIWKKLKNFFKSEEAPYLKGNNKHCHYPNWKEDIKKMEAEMAAREKEIQEIENRILKKFDKRK